MIETIEDESKEVKEVVYDRLSNVDIQFRNSSHNSFLIQKWFSDKNLYLNTQVCLSLFNLAMSLVSLGLCVWVNVDSRFVLIKNLANQLTFSSLSKLIGVFGFITGVVSIMSVCLDLIQLFSFYYVRNVLNKFDEYELEKIWNNQLILAKMGNLGSQSSQLELRCKIRRRYEAILFSFRVIEYSMRSVYVLLVLGAQFTIGLCLHFHANKIVTVQISQTMNKLFKVYHALVESENVPNQIFKEFEAGSLERNLTDTIHAVFECCGYKNAFEFGYLTPRSCNLERACFYPVQDCLWYLVYFSVVYLLFVAAAKVLIQLVLGVNFRVVLVGRLLQDLFEYNWRRSKRKVLDDEPGEDEDEKWRNEEKLIWKRRQKELMLQLEDEKEEEERRQNELSEYM